MKVKEESEKVGLNLNIQKTKTTESAPITSFQIDWETMETLLLMLLSRFSCVRLCATPETAAYQAPPPMGFSRQEYRSEAIAF